MNESESNNNGKLWFFFTLLYLIFDYGRPHNMIPGLAEIRPLMILILILSAFVLIQGGFQFFWNAQLNIIWLFIAIIALEIPFAENRRYAFRTFKAMMLYMPFVLSVVFTVTTVERLKKLMLISVMLMITLSVYSILNSGRGPGNYFLDENDVSLYINTWLPFCYFLLVVEKEAWKRIVYAAGLVTGLVGVVVSFSRGGFVGLIATAAVVWLFSSRKVAALAGLAVLSSVVFYVGDEAYWNEMSTVTDTEESTANVRILSWEAGWDMFLDNPLGVGGNNFQIRFPDYQSPEFKRSMYGRVAHSLWFTLIPELGVFGIAIFLILLLINLRSLFGILADAKLVEDQDARYLQALSRAFLAGFAGFFASGTFVSVLYYAHYWYLTAFIIAAEEITRDLFEPREV